MTNVLKFPGGGAIGSSEARHVGYVGHVGAAFLADPAPHSHAVHFYDNDEFLFVAVGQFLAAGLKSGDRLVVIATEEHREGFQRGLAAYGFDEAVASGQLVMLDARATLAKFMVGTMPDPDLFRDMLSRTLIGLTSDASTEPRDPRALPRVRAYGEMVDLLWREGNSSAAIRLEELWNEAGKDHSFTLLCAYVMGNFYKEGDSAKFMEVCRNHSHVIPTESFVALDDSHARLREIALLQQRAHSLSSEIEHRKKLEIALREALRERAQAESALRASLEREKLARRQAEESDAFKEVFLGMLGHDLRNPLNTVLTTARLMAIRQEIPAESRNRLDRIISSGVRMHRMIEQILDVTRARLASGIPVTSTLQDIAPIVSKIVDEVQAANPTRTIDLRSAGTCTAYVDADRFEQVISNLLCNAIAHGDPTQPITVDVTSRETGACVGVHNRGEAIDAAFLPVLFDPWKREKPQAGSDGLGLGLYISERIVTACGGTIVVSSDNETGTRFEVNLPRR